MTLETSWNSEKARYVFAHLTKIAESMLDQAEQAPSPESAGTAGPQEAVDALSEIVAQLEQVIAAIPAEPAGESGLEAPVNAPEQPEVVAQLKTQIAELTSKVEGQEIERVAQEYAELYSDANVKQAKYNEVIGSTESTEFWNAKIQAVSEYQKEAGVNAYKPAQQTTSWLKPRSKFAQQGNALVRL